MGNEEQQRMLELARQESWIKTPFSYTRLGKKLTLLQQDAMLMVSDHLQKYIKDFYDLHLDRSKNKPRSLFAKHLLQNGIPGFKIYLARPCSNASVCLLLATSTKRPMSRVR